MNETLKRSLSGSVYVILLIACIQYSTQENFISFFLLFGIFLLIAVIEFCNLLHIGKIAPIVIANLLYLFNYEIAIAEESDGFLYVLRYSALFDLFILFLTILVSIKCFVFLFDSKNNKIDSFSKYVYLLGYILLPFIIITKIPFGINGYNPKIIISIFILIWTNDTFAYLVGKSIGRTKLFEKISPKKTIEGFVGGVIFAVIASYFISKYYIEGSQFIWIIIAIIVGIFGTIGDLVESKFKRLANIKDSGKIMPGHGGILDRLDSVIFVAPIIYLFYQILFYVS